MNASALIEKFLNVKLEEFTSTLFFVGNAKFALQKIAGGRSYYRYAKSFNHPIVEKSNELIDDLFSNFNGIVNFGKKQLIQHYTVSRELVVDINKEMVSLQYSFMSKKDNKIPLKFNIYENATLNYSNFVINVFADGTYSLSGMKNYGYSLNDDVYEYRDLDTFMLFHNFGRNIKNDFGLDEDRTKTAELVIMQFI